MYLKRNFLKKHAYLRTIELLCCLNIGENNYSLAPFKAKLLDPLVLPPPPSNLRLRWLAQLLRHCCRCEIRLPSWRNRTQHSCRLSGLYNLWMAAGLEDFKRSLRSLPLDLSCILFSLVVVLPRSFCFLLFCSLISCTCNLASQSINQCRQRFATAAWFPLSCVAQALSRGDGCRHSSQVLP